MSSLRLALKQSLQESGLQSSSSSERRKKKKKKKSRQKAYHNDDNNNNDSHSGESSEENEFSAQDESDDDEESNNDNTNNRDRIPRHRRKGTSNGNSDEDNDSDSDTDSSSSSSSILLKKQQQHFHHQHQQHRKSPDIHQHDEQRKKQHSAANTIQSRWKRKQESMPLEDDDDEENDGDDENNDSDNDSDNDDNNDGDDDSSRERGDRGNNKSKQSTKHQGGKSSNTSISRSKHKQSGSKNEITTKAMTVSSPDPAIVEWMGNMPVKKSRRSIVPGMRVKVRFETKVLVRRKEKKSASGSEQATTKKEIVQKKKWFGGRVSAVSKEGSKIRIKYDDGTTEVTKFPDNDVVVDDTDNGEHQVPADVFIPPRPAPPESPPQSPPTKETPPAPGPYGNDHNDHEASDLVDTPMQQTPVNNAVDLRYAPKIALHRDVRPDVKEQSHNRLRDVYEEPEGLSSPSSLKLSMSSTSYDPPAVQENLTIIPEPIIDTSQSMRGKSPVNEDMSKHSENEEANAKNASMSPEIKSLDHPAIKAKEEEIIAQLIKASADVSYNHTTESPLLEMAPPSTKNDNIDSNIPEVQQSGSNDAASLPPVKAIGDDASINTEIHPFYHKRKRGRPPKDHSGAMSVENSPTVDPDRKHKDNITDTEIAVRSPEVEPKIVLDKAHTDVDPIEEKPLVNKPTLKIRIAARLSDEHGKSPRSLKLILGDVPLDGKKTNKVKKSRDESPEGERPPAKKFHIHIPSQQQLVANESTIDNSEKQESDEITEISPKRSQKRKIVVASESVALMASAKLSPQQRKKRKKLAGKKEPGADDAMGVEEAEKDAFHDGPVTAKMIRLKKLSQPSVTKHDSEFVINNDGNAKPVSIENNAVESIQGKNDNFNHKLITPNEPKKIIEDVPSSVRSGRRAAQQANEKISSKNDPDMQGGKKKKKQKEGEKGKENTGVVTVDDCRWVQCDKCKKWRVIPSNVVDSLPDLWFCSDNIYDPKRANCDAPEQTDKEVAREKKRKLKKKQRLMMQIKNENEENDNETPAAPVASTNDSNVTDAIPPIPLKTQEQKANKDNTNLHIKKEKEKVTERSRTPQPFPTENDQIPVSTTKTKRLVVPESNSVATPNEENNDEPQLVPIPISAKQERRLSSMGKKIKLVSGEGSQAESSKACNVNLETVQTNVEVRRGRGRPRRNPGKDVVPSGGGNSVDGYKGCDDDNLEWVQCEKCDKWRRLPSHISADDLPEQWYCEMNTWNPESASCEVPEDKADGMQDIGGFGGTGGMGLGKLTYRNLIFGSTGRKLNRPVTEKARAAESLFSIHQDEDEMPTP